MGARSRPAPLKTRSYVALGYTFGFWASVLFSGHFRAVLDSPKPKLFIQARTIQGATSLARSACGSLGLGPLTRLSPPLQGSRDEFTAPSKLLEVRTHAARPLWQAGQAAPAWL